MSRCFPFPPPGYSGKCSSNEALIYSIKLQQEKEKSKPDREREKSSKSSERKKDRKKEKKEKKEKKREERKSSSGGKNEKQKVIEKLYQADKCGVEPNAKCNLQEDASGQLERSSVTEEHGRPCLQNVSCSSDSTSNSSKRKRLSTPPSSIQSNGNVLRIRLSSSQKRDEPSTSGSKEQEINGNLQRRSDHAASYSKVQPCSNVVRTQNLVKPRDITVEAPQVVSHSASTSNGAIQLVSRQDKAVVPSLPRVGKTESVVPKEKLEPKEKLSSHEKKLRKKESKYNKLFGTWVPPALESVLLVQDGEDDDWLFGKKGEEREAKRMKTSDVESCGGDNLLSCASSALQPRSIFLPDADIYALPYTVPF